MSVMQAVKEAHEIEASLSGAPCSTFDSEHLENKGIMDSPQEQVSKILTHIKKTKKIGAVEMVQWLRAWLLFQRS